MMQYSSCTNDVQCGKNSIAFIDERGLKSGRCKWNRQRQAARCRSSQQASPDQFGKMAQGKRA
jgi:hypothetical protein